MESLHFIGLLIVALIAIVGIFKVIFAPYNGFVNFLVEIMLLDWLGDILGFVFEGMADLID